MTGTRKAAFLLACALCAATTVLAVVTTVSWGLSDSYSYGLAAAAFAFAAFAIRYGAKRS